MSRRTIGGLRRLWDESKAKEVDRGGAELGFGENRRGTTRGGWGIFKCKEIRGEEGVGGG